MLIRLGKEVGPILRRGNRDHKLRDWPEDGFYKCELQVRQHYDDEGAEAQAGKLIRILQVLL
jgi:hypothetical protein